MRLNNPTVAPKKMCQHAKYQWLLLHHIFISVFGLKALKDSRSLKKKSYVNCTVCANTHMHARTHLHL